MPRWLFRRALPNNLTWRESSRVFNGAANSIDGILLWVIRFDRFHVFHQHLSPHGNLLAHLPGFRTPSEESPSKKHNWNGQIRLRMLISCDFMVWNEFVQLCSFSKLHSNRQSWCDRAAAGAKCVAWNAR
jgi:hypothetical protein